MQNKKRKSSKNRKVRQQIVVADEAALVAVNMSGSANFGSGANASTKRGAFDSELGTSHDV